MLRLVVLHFSVVCVTQDRSKREIRGNGFDAMHDGKTVRELLFLFFLFIYFFYCDLTPSWEEPGVSFFREPEENSLLTNFS